MLAEELAPGLSVLNVDVCEANFRPNFGNDIIFRTTEGRRNSEETVNCVVYADFIAAFALRFRPSLTATEPKNAPTADIPTTRMNAGIRTAHSLDGKKPWMGLSSGKKG